MVQICQYFSVRMSLTTRSYDQMMNWTLRTLTLFHKNLHRLSGGRLGRTFPGGAAILWLTTPGRISGQPRVTPLLSAEDGLGNWIVAGSAGGQSQVPNWALNARAAAPNSLAECWIEIGSERFEVRVVEILKEVDRANAYKQLIKKWRFFRNYANRTSRTIPVFLLIPDGEATRRSRRGDSPLTETRNKREATD